MKGVLPDLNKVRKAPFLLYRKDRLRRSHELKKARRSAGATSGRLPGQKM